MKGEKIDSELRKEIEDWYIRSTGTIVTDKSGRVRLMAIASILIFPAPPKGFLSDSEMNRMISSLRDVTVPLKGVLEKMIFSFDQFFDAFTYQEKVTFGELKRVRSEEELGLVIAGDRGSQFTVFVFYRFFV